MTDDTNDTNLPRLSNAEDFARADDCWDKGNFKKAFKIFLSLAHRGDVASQLNVGYFFDYGISVRKNKPKALYWYRRAYARGSASAAQNIGTVFRDRGNFRRAEEWFRRALDCGGEGGALELAKLHLNSGKHLDRAREYLETVARSDKVSEFEKDEAKKLMRGLGQKKLKRVLTAKTSSAKTPVRRGSVQR